MIKNQFLTYADYYIETSEDFHIIQQMKATISKKSDAIVSLFCVLLLEDTPDNIGL